MVCPASNFPSFLSKLFRGFYSSFSANFPPTLHRHRLRLLTAIPFFSSFLYPPSYCPSLRVFLFLVPYTFGISSDLFSLLQVSPFFVFTSTTLICPFLLFSRFFTIVYLSHSYSNLSTYILACSVPSFPTPLR